MKPKVCRVCQTPYPNTRRYFGVHQGCVKGLRSVCRSCYSARETRRYHERKWARTVALIQGV